MWDIKQLMTMILQLSRAPTDKDWFADAMADDLRALFMKDELQVVGHTRWAYYVFNYTCLWLQP